MEKNRIDLLQLLEDNGINLELVNTSAMHDAVDEIAIKQLFTNLKRCGEEVNGGYEYTYPESERPAVLVTSMDDYEDFLALSIRMEDDTDFRLIAKPYKYDDSEMELTKCDLEHGHIDFLNNFIKKS